MSSDYLPNAVIRDADQRIADAARHVQHALSSGDLAAIHLGAATLHSRVASDRIFRHRYLNQPTPVTAQERDAVFLFAAASIALGDSAAAREAVAQHLADAPTPGLQHAIRNGDPAALAGLVGGLANLPVFAPHLDRIKAVIAAGIAAADIESDGFFAADACYDPDAASLTPMAERLIAAALDAGADMTDVPSQVPTFAARPRTCRLLLVANFPNERVDRCFNTASDLLRASAEAAGLEVDTFNASEITLNVGTQADEVVACIQDLAATIDRVKPDLVFTMGNYIPRDGFDLTGETWAQLKRVHPFKLVCYISDLIPTAVDMSAFWEPACDLFLTAAAPSSYTARLDATNRRVDFLGWMTGRAPEPDWSAKDGLRDLYIPIKWRWTTILLSIAAPGIALTSPAKARRGCSPGGSMKHCTAAASFSKAP